MSYFTLNLAKRVMGTFKIFQYVKLLLKNKRRSASRNEIIVPRTTFDFELDVRIWQRSYIELGGLFAPFKFFFPIFHHHVTRSFTILGGIIPPDIEALTLCGHIHMYVV